MHMLLLSTYCDDYPIHVSSPELVPSPVSHPAPTPPCELCIEPHPLAPFIATSTQDYQPTPLPPIPPNDLQGSGHPMEPKGFKIAAKDPKWLVAMCDEMKALKLNAT
ncbi:hypothetical protein Tco_0748445 [Tanacetum coccineum]|uniref:Uncharacterized protein n=1 Tax=Tanacetum coccineum TaxID=301880 RepID=A0ABQ4YVM8_9ASTR